MRDTGYDPMILRLLENFKLAAPIVDFFVAFSAERDQILERVIP